MSAGYIIANRDNVAFSKSVHATPESAWEEYLGSRWVSELPIMVIAALLKAMQEGYAVRHGYLMVGEIEELKGA